MNPEQVTDWVGSWVWHLGSLTLGTLLMVAVVARVDAALWQWVRDAWNEVEDDEDES